jgi:K+/H+ antiporter YhaU regulatory subunit KhtT
MKGKAMAFNKVTFEEVDAKVDSVLNELTELSNEIKQMEVNMSADIRKLHNDAQSKFRRIIISVLLMWVIYSIMIVAMYFIMKNS